MSICQSLWTFSVLTFVSIVVTDFLLSRPFKWTPKKDVSWWYCNANSSLRTTGLKVINGLASSLLAVFAADVRMIVDKCIWQREHTSLMELVLRSAYYLTTLLVMYRWRDRRVRHTNLNSSRWYSTVRCIPLSLVLSTNEDECALDKHSKCNTKARKVIVKLNEMCLNKVVTQNGDVTGICITLNYLASTRERW